VQCCQWTATLFNLTPSVGSSECISKSTVNFQTVFFPPQRVPDKDIYDSARKERLGIVYIAVDVLRGMVAQNSVGSTVGTANNDKTSFEKKREGGGRGDGDEHNT